MPPFFIQRPTSPFWHLAFHGTPDTVGSCHCGKFWLAYMESHTLPRSAGLIVDARHFKLAFCFFVVSDRRCATAVVALFLPFYAMCVKTLCIPSLMLRVSSIVKASGSSCCRHNRRVSFKYFAQSPRAGCDAVCQMQRAEIKQALRATAPTIV